MFKRIRIKNFMSVAEQTIDLTGINVFIGKTDAGKSVVLRAIQAVIDNSFPADTYARHGTKEYEIILYTDKGNVQLIKGKTTCYRIAYLNTKGEVEQKEFNAIGRDIPEKVREILSSDTLKLSDDTELDVLYQYQHKPFFLISENRATFSRVISLISQSDKLNTLEKNVNSDILICKRNITKNQEIVDDYKAQLFTTEQQLKKLDKYKTIEIDSLPKIKELEDISRKVQRIVNAQQFARDIEVYESTKDVIIPDSSNLDSVKEMSSRISSLKLAITVCELPDLKEHEYFEYNNSIAILHNLIEKKEVYSREWDEIEEFSKSRNGETLQSVIKDFEYLDSLDSLIKDEELFVENEIKQLDGQICPVCGNTIHLGDHEH